MCDADLLCEVVLSINGQAGGGVDLLGMVGPLSQALLVALQVALTVLLHTDDVWHSFTLQGSALFHTRFHHNEQGGTVDAPL